MLIKINSAAIQGLQAMPVTVEVDGSQGMMFHMVGLPDNAVKESTERIRAAIKNSGQHFPAKQLTINLAPADVKKEGSGYDLPIAIGILGLEGVVQMEQTNQFLMVGELSLDGSLQPITGALLIAILARSKGYKGLIVPHQNVSEAAVVNNLEVYGAHDLTEVIELVNGRGFLQPTIYDTRREFQTQQEQYEYDFSDVKGQQQVKRALEVAAAGGHNLIMVGPPGSGKSMLAKRLPSILPPLSLSESLETTQIHSVAGKVGRNTSLIATRPFRSPHHTISQVALVGGGQTAQPGEISLAHNGVLFLDELPEFNRSVLEVLRQPLEDREICIARARYTITYPANFMFVASMNPCPCGYYNDPTHHCSCTQGQIQRYMSKISGPLMDRIDIQIEISPLPFSDLAKTEPGEPSSAIRQRVIRAREMQEQRYRNHPGIHCNAQMNSKLLRQYAQLDETGAEMLRAAMEKLQLSARAYDRILRVSRTIADLDGSEQIQSQHVSEAINYRNLDRSTWGER